MVPKSIKDKIEDELKEIVEHTIRGKRAKGVIGVEKEIHREIVKK